MYVRGSSKLRQEAKAALRHQNETGSIHLIDRKFLDDLATAGRKRDNESGIIARRFGTEGEEEVFAEHMDPKQTVLA